MSNSTGKAAARIAALLDEASFVEIGGFVKARSTDFTLKQAETPADGVITGYGTIGGQLVYVYSQDAGVLGGSVGEMHAKKIVRLYELAMKVGAPVIGLVDCAGLRLQEATDALAAVGSWYSAQTLASGVIPQITAIFGVCGGGMALVPGLTDFTFMEKDKAQLFVNAPNTLDGRKAEKTSSAAFQAAEAGLVDGTGSEAEVFAAIRELVSFLPANNEDEPAFGECEDDLNRICAGLEAGAEDTVYAISQIADNGVFCELKAAYAPEMVTGFIRLDGSTVGVVANRAAVTKEDGTSEKLDAVLTPEGCTKAAEFVNFCDAFNLPVVTLTNVKGYKADLESEKRVARAAAKLTFAFADASVPKVNVIVGQAYGTAGIVMNSKSVGADIVYAWPDAKIGMMDAQAAAKIMYAKELEGAEDAPAMIAEKAAEYEALQSSAQAAAGRGYVDDIIAPEGTRKRVIAALEMLYTKREDRPVRKHGTV